MKHEQKDRWMMYRAKLFNFWYYPDQTFYFQNGCGVLRGHNGSGKSVTTQSLITVLLDGDTRSHKLDPFGGRERKMMDTVLGEEELTGIQERIGYLTLEFKKENSEIFKTIGMGIEASRSRSTTKNWYFIIDGMRFGDDSSQLKLYKEEVMDGDVRKIPLTEKDFRKLVEPKKYGKVFNNRDDYADNVNRHLFGFDSIQSYKGLIDLLLQTRSPKLSDQKRPDGVVEVLNDSLPQLTNDELRPLTSSIESIDRIEKDLKRSEADLTTLKKLNKTYGDYNEMILVEKATEYVLASKNYEKLKTSIKSTQKEIDRQMKRIHEIDDEKKKLNNQLEANKEEIRSLGVEDIEEIEKRKQDSELELSKLSQALEKLENKKLEADRSLSEIKREKEKYEIELSDLENNYSSYVNEIEEIGNDLHFEKHERYFNHFHGSMNESQYSFGQWVSESRGYEQFLQRTKKQLEQRDLLESVLKSISNQQGDLQMNIDQAQLEILSIERRIDEEVNNLVESVQLWLLNCKEMHIDEQVNQNLVYQIQELYNSISEASYKSQIDGSHSKSKEHKLERNIQLRHEAKVIEQECSSLKKDIKEWTDTKEIEPDFVSWKREGWNRLSEEGVSYLPFYEAFEFLPTVSEEERRKIQNALSESGLLSSVIVEPKFVSKSKEHTTVVDYHPSKRNNLTSVLKSSDNDPNHHSILEGISIERDKEGYILTDGQFRSGFVEGRSSSMEKVMFIGKASRESYRKMKISELEESYNAKVLELDNITKMINENKLEIATLEEEYRSFPTFKSLEELHREKENVVSRIKDIYEPQREKLDMEFHTKLEEKQSITTQIKKEIDFTELDLTVHAFDEEMECLSGYLQCLQDIEKTFIEINGAKQNVGHFHERFSYIEEHLDEYALSIGSTKASIDATKRKISSYQERLKDMGSDEIRERIQHLTKEINETVPNQLSSLQKESIELEVSTSNKKEENEHNKEVYIPFKRHLHDVWEKAFNEHYKLGYFVVDGRDDTLLSIAKEILESKGDILDKKRDNVEKVKDRLHRTFNKLNVELTNYELEYETKQSDNTSEYVTEDDEENSVLNYVSGKTSRIEITLNIEGKRVPPSYAVNHLQEKIDNMRIDANEKDRDLYERILINTLGDNLKRKIEYVQSWEKEMNRFMEHENLIKFRLKWVPREKDEEEELDTRDLVEALKKDSQWVDLSEISKHFKSKINQAKKIHNASQGENNYNLQVIMKDVLDYRKWFDFHIYFTKKGDKEHRLTRKTYGKLSGGQRVLAMITPVLAALYAKYSEANDECPRLFTLDEAFSRVDDDNINVMFAYIRKLNFNYILNSQSLWGCFESVPSLNIYELIRPENRPKVLVQSYYWNGKRKERQETIEVKEEVEA